jgi:hypothetical protein
MKARHLVFVALVLGAGCRAPSGEIAEDALNTRALVTTLASDAMQGRVTGSAGERRAGDYVIAQLERIGAKPLPGRSDYRMPFEFTAGARDGGSSMSVQSHSAEPRRFDSRTDIQALSFSDQGNVSGAVVFAGYGIVIPPGQEVAYDSYANRDVKDKIVLVLRYFPENADRNRKALLARYADLRHKARAAREHGAKGILVVAGPSSPNAGAIIPMSFDTAIDGAGVVAASVSDRVAAALFANSGRTLANAQRALDDGDANVAGFDLPNVTTTVVTSVVREKRTGNNVLAYLPATTNSAVSKPWIVLGAHYDHLGHGEAGTSLAGKEETGRVHPGADDNASGVAAVLAAGARLATEPRERNVLLAFWSGEEIGLLGSAAFAAAQPIPLESIAAYLNFDMVGRMQDNKLFVQATGTSNVWRRMLERTNVSAGFDVVVQDDPYQPTDVATFNDAGVPSLSFFTGGHTDYHRPTDTADKIDYRDLDRVAAFAADVASRIGVLATPPAFVKVERPSATRPSRGAARVFTGTIPDYASDVKGLRLMSVIGGGPADKAGLEKGDVIVEIAGQSVANIYDYTNALDALKPGVAVKLVYTRAGERRETTLTPAARN